MHQVYKQTEADHLMEDSSWSRVKNREQMEHGDIEMFSYKDDYLIHQQQDLNFI